MRGVVERGIGHAITSCRARTRATGASTANPKLWRTVGTSTPPLPSRERAGVRGAGALSRGFLPPTPTLPLKGGGGKTAPVSPV